MSADESFLARWARRKRGAAQNALTGPMPKKGGDGAASKDATASVPPEDAQSLFDPHNLPPIESIGVTSDIRPFLAAGVPADLTRAALRRAWSADPAIRDFIGLSENSWDFNAPGAVSGFGSLTAEDARRLLGRVSGETKTSDPADSPSEPSSHDRASAPASGPGQQRPANNQDQMKLARDMDADHRNSMADVETDNIAVRHERGERESRSLAPRSRHGGALPD